MLDFEWLVKEYGIASAIGVVLSGFVGRMYYMSGKKYTEYDKEIESINERLDSVHDQCHIPEGTITRLCEDVEQLKKENSVFQVELKNFKDAIDKMDNKLDKLISFHMEK